VAIDSTNRSEAASKLQIRFKGKAQADRESAAYVKYVSIYRMSATQPLGLRWGFETASSAGENKMEVTRARLLEGARNARGVAVIIDVFRAFTCAPLLFSFGIRKSILVSTPEEAFALKQKNGELLLIGEVGGIPIEGFDLGNSPSEILYRGASFFKDKTVVQRTSAGVQGVLAALGGADEVLPASYSLAQATARYILLKQAPKVSVVAMGWSLKYPSPEDEWCARYIAHLLGAADYDHYEALAEILPHKTTQKFFDPEQPHFPPEDPIMCLQLNSHNFVLRAGRDDDGVVINKIDPAHGTT